MLNIQKLKQLKRRLHNLWRLSDIDVKILEKAEKIQEISRKPASIINLKDPIEEILKYD